MAAAASSRWEIDAIDYRVNQQSIFLRVAGPAACQRRDRERDSIDVGRGCERLWNSPDDFWRSVRELNWSPESPIAVKVPCYTRPTRSAV